MRRLSIAVFVCVIVSVTARSTRATPMTWNTGDVLAYDQGGWSNIPAAVSLLINDFATVYHPSGIVTVGLSGTGFTMRFDGPLPVAIYLPAGGAPAALDANVLDPLTTVSGEFGGNVLALALNVDFSDAGLLLGTSGIPFGDLVLENFGPLSLLNGRTIRQILAADNTDLGGGASIFSIADLDALTEELNASFDCIEPGNGFECGFPSAFAQEHVPEPATLTLLGAGIIGMGARRARVRRAASDSAD